MKFISRRILVAMHETVPHGIVLRYIDLKARKQAFLFNDWFINRASLSSTSVAVHEPGFGARGYGAGSGCRFERASRLVLVDEG
jgi:hypothetical protein